MLQNPAQYFFSTKADCCEVRQAKRIFFLYYPMCIHLKTTYLLTNRSTTIGISRNVWEPRHLQAPANTIPIGLETRPARMMGRLPSTWSSTPPCGCTIRSPTVARCVSDLYIYRIQIFRRHWLTLTFSCARIQANYAWKLNDCMGTTPTASTGKFYPDWSGSNKGCLNDGGEPQYSE